MTFWDEGEMATVFWAGNGRCFGEKTRTAEIQPGASSLNPAIWLAGGWWVHSFTWGSSLRLSCDNVASCMRIVPYLTSHILSLLHKPISSMDRISSFHLLYCAMFYHILSFSLLIISIIKLYAQLLWNFTGFCMSGEFLSSVSHT